MRLVSGQTFDHVRRRFRVFLELHGVGGTTLAHRAQIGRVPKHLGERHRSGKLLAGRDVFHALDGAATAIQIAHHVTHVFFRRDDFHVHHRLEQHRRCLTSTVLERHRAGYFKRGLARVNIVIGAVIKRDLEVDHRVTRDHTVGHRLLDTLVHGVDVFLRHHTAGDGVDELVAGAGLFLRLEPQIDMTVLATTTRLAHELAFLLDFLANGLAVRDLRRTDIRLDAELTLHAIDNDLEVKLTHAGNNGLRRFLVGAHLEGRILLGQLRQRDAHLLLIGAGFGLHGNGNNRIRELHALENHLGVRRAQRVTGGYVLQTNHRGDIAAVVGLKNVTTGYTLCAPDSQVILERMEFPDPVIAVAVEPKSRADQEKMGVALSKLAQEDPSFQVRTDEETAQTIISGMGELHLEIIVDRMKREFGVEANVGAPQVAYRETIRKEVEQEGKFVRQSGGRGQYGHVYLRLEPQEEAGTGYEFVNAITGGVVPKEYINSVDKGVQEAMANGVVAGYPMVDLKVTLYDGSYHDVDSSEAAFKIAGSMAFKDGARQASPVLLEPMMDVEVVTPEEYMGDVMGDLNRRRGTVKGMEDIPTGKQLSAAVPLSEMFGYSTDLRSMSQGRATYTMQFEKYSEAPSHVIEGLTRNQSQKA